MAALVEAGFMAAVSGTAGSVIGAEAWPAVLLSSSWLVFVAPLRAFRAFEALLRVVFFTGFDTLAGSTVLALVSVAAFTGLTGLVFVLLSLDCALKGLERVRGDLQGVTRLGSYTIFNFPP